MDYKTHLELISQLKTQTAGPSWYDMPAPDAADLPKMYREVEALRLRNQLDPKRFYRKDEGEGKGFKGLPKYFAVSFAMFTHSTILLISTPDWNNRSRENTIWVR